METNYLKEFIEFSKSLNYAHAANNLYLSQPTLRAHIKTLEDELGASLTLKRKNEIDLSPVGKLFLKKARAIIEFSEEAFEECRTYSQGTTLITVSNLGHPLFDEIITEARESYSSLYPGKNIDIRLSHGMNSNLEALEENVADLILFSHVRENQHENTPEFPDFPAGIESFYFIPAEVMFWVSKESPLFSQQTIEDTDLQGLTLLLGSSQNMVAAGEIIYSMLKEKGVRIHVNNCPFASYHEYLISSANDSFGITHIDTAPDHKGIKVFGIKDMPIRSDLFAVCNSLAIGQEGMVFFEILKDIALNLFCNP